MRRGLAWLTRGPGSRASVRASACGHVLRPKQKFEDGRFDHATYLGLLAKLYGVGDARTVEEEAEKLLKRELENGRLDSHATYVALLAKLYEV